MDGADSPDRSPSDCASISARCSGESWSRTHSTGPLLTSLEQNENSREGMATTQSQRSVDATCRTSGSKNGLAGPSSFVSRTRRGRRPTADAGAALAIAWRMRAGAADADAVGRINIHRERETAWPTRAGAEEVNFTLGRNEGEEYGKKKHDKGTIYICGACNGIRLDIES